MSVLFSAIYAKCPYCLVLYMQSRGHAGGHAPRAGAAAQAHVDALHDVVEEPAVHGSREGVAREGGVLLVERRVEDLLAHHLGGVRERERHVIRAALCSSR